MLEKIGKYEIRQELGRGAMGIVYEGYDTVIGRRVAVKTLRTEMFEPRQLPQVLERFKREAQLAGRLSHPHIVTIHDYGEREGTPYIVMEYITGRELGGDLARGVRYALDDTLRLMTQLLGALAHAHEHGVVHRDVKPANMFVLEDGSLKVVDFGIARVEESELTDTGAIMGTPAYMSPEQFLGLTAEARSDLYSAGVIFYQMLTGDKPFTGSVTTIMHKVLRVEPPAPSDLNPTLTTAWDTIVARAMAKKPEARYASARQFSEAIKLAYQAERGRGAQPDMTVAVELRGLRAGAGEKARAQAAQKEEEARRAAARIERMAAEDTVLGEAEQRARAEAEEHARREAERKGEDARRAAEDRVRAEAAEKARREAELAAAAKAGAEELVRKQAEARAKQEAEDKAKADTAALADARAAKEAADKAEVERSAAEKKAKAEAAALAAAEARTKKEAEEKARAEALAKKEAEDKAAAAKKAEEARAQAHKPGEILRDCPRLPAHGGDPRGRIHDGHAGVGSRTL